MRTIALALTISILGGTALADQTPAPVIERAQIEAAAQTVAAQDKAPASDPDTKAVKKNTTWIIVLLCVLIVGAGVYLIADNANKHGSGGLLAKRQLDRSVAEFKSELLRPQWQPR